MLEPAQAPGHRVNGQLTIGENIGDLGGLSIAFRAYQIAHNGNPEPELDGYAPEQRLFVSWAAVWQAKVRTEMLLQRLATDPHCAGGVPLQPDRSKPPGVLRRLRRRRLRRPLAG